MKTISLVGIFLTISLITYSQANKSLAERLGFDKDAKMLIIHADDLGLSHGTNKAAIEAFKNGGINSGSVMVTCPWFPEIAQFAKSNSHLDLGVHLAFTSEWDSYFFGGISSPKCIPNLLNEKGYFYPSVSEFSKHANLPEIEIEIRAQIERAISFGIKPTHLDNHMGSIMFNPEFYKVLLKIGNEYKLPVFIPANMIANSSPDFIQELYKKNIVVDNLFMINKSVDSDKWSIPYIDFIDNMKPGLNQIIVHLAYNTDESKAIMVNHSDFGAEWRQNDLDLVLNSEFKDALVRNNIKLVSWKQIKDIQYP